MKKNILFLFFLFISNAFIFAQTSLIFTKEIFNWNNNKGVLPYQISKPKDQSKKYPLVIYLHGAGERGTDNQKQLSNGADTFLKKFVGDYSSIIIAPQCPPNTSTNKKNYWSNAIDETSKGYTFDLTRTEPTIPMQMLMDLIQTYINSGNVDTDEIYVGGFSMGAFGTYELLWRMPNVFKAAFALSGGSTEDKDKLQSYASNTKVWMFHGTLDNIVPIKYGNDIYNSLQQIPSSSVRYTIYKNIYHMTTAKAFNESDLIPWLFGYNSLDNGYYKITTNDNSNNAITLSNTNCTVNKFNGIDNQQWLIRKATADTYYIQAGNGSNQYLTIDNNELAIRTKLNTTKQTWKIKESADKGSFYILSAYNNQSIDLNGTNLVLSDMRTKYKWNISNSRLYIIDFPKPNQYKDVKSSIFMQLDTSRNGIFKWNGFLESGQSEFKFLTVQDNNWLPSVNAVLNKTKVDVGNNYKLIVNSKDYDKDFKFSINDAGIYTVTVDMVNKSMCIDEDYTNLYITGDATYTNKYDYSKSLIMKKDNEYFEWSGYLKPGTFRFLLQNTSFNPSFGAPEYNQEIAGNNGSINTQFTINNPNNYSIKEAGFYVIKLNTKSKTFTYQRKNIGNIYVTNTSSNNVATIEKNTSNNTLYKYTGNLYVGSIQLYIVNPFTNEKVYLNPTKNNQNLVSNSDIKFSTDNNLYWSVPKTSDSYRLFINVSDNILSCENFIPRSTKYYLIGSAVKSNVNNWSLNDMIEFTKDANHSYIYTLTTTFNPTKNLNGNQFKILQQKNWWGYSFHPSSYNKLLNEGSDSYVENYGYGGNNDYKWTMNVSNSGKKYQVTLNLLDETITLTPIIDASTKTIIASENKNEVDITTELNNILIKNYTSKNIDNAYLMHLGSGKVLTNKMNQKGDFYIGVNLPSGLYIVKIILGKSIYSKKILIN